MLARQVFCHLSYASSSFLLYFFWMCFTFLPGVVSDSNPPTYGLPHRWGDRSEPPCLAYWLRGGLTNSLPGLVLNCDLSDFCLASSWDYRHEPQHLTKNLVLCKGRFIGLGPALLQCDLILPWSHWQRLCFLIQSYSEALGGLDFGRARGHYSTHYTPVCQGCDIHLPTTCDSRWPWGYIGKAEHSSHLATLPCIIYHPSREAEVAVN
jgi:hypothetical protein